MWNQDRFYGMYRQISGIIPKNFLTDEEYNEIELKYREIRTLTAALRRHLKEIATYEHGGPTYKMILEGIEKAKGHVKIGDKDLSDNMYNVGEGIFKNLCTYHQIENAKNAAEKLANINKGLVVAKHTMNKKINELAEELKIFKKLSVTIDDERTKMKNVQFKAEKLIEQLKVTEPNKNHDENPDLKILGDSFKQKLQECKTSMNNFVNDKCHITVLEGLVEAYNTYAKDANALSQ